MYWNLVFVYLKPLACINNCKGRYVVYIKFVMPSTFIFYHWFKISKWQVRRQKNWRKKKRFVIVTLNSLNLRLGKSKQPYILFSVFFLFQKNQLNFLCFNSSNSVLIFLYITNQKKLYLASLLLVFMCLITLFSFSRHSCIFWFYRRR